MYGYKGDATNFSGINNIVDNYNTSRPWLDKEMKKFGYLDGFTMSTGVIASHLWMDLGASFMGKKHSAEGVNPANNTLVTRDLKIKANHVDFDFGVSAGGNAFGIGFGLKTDIGRLKFKSRVYADSGDKGKLESIVDDQFLLRLGPVLKLFFIDNESRLSVSAGVYYAYSLLRYNYTRMDEILNNNYYSYVDQPEFDLRPNAFGFTITAGVLMF